MIDLVCTGCGEYAGSDIAEIVGAQAAKIARLTAVLEKAEAKNAVAEKVAKDWDIAFAEWKGLTDGE